MLHLSPVTLRYVVTITGALHGTLLRARPSDIHGHAGYLHAGAIEKLDAVHAANSELKERRRAPFFEINNIRLAANQRYTSEHTNGHQVQS